MADKGLAYLLLIVLFPDFSLQVGESQCQRLLMPLRAPDVSHAWIHALLRRSR